MLVLPVNTSDIFLSNNNNLYSGEQLHPKVFIYRRVLDTKESNDRNKDNNNTIQNYLEYEY